MDAALAYFLDLRLRVRGAPEALAIVDRCLLLLARSASADPEALGQIEREIDRLRVELARRFGPAKPRVLH